MSRGAALCALVLAAGCGGGPPGKGADGPGDPERRERFLAGASAAEARALVESNNPAHLDAVAAFFLDPAKPYPERVAALAALRLLRDRDAEEYARLYARLREKLWIEAARGDGLTMSPLEEKAFLEALSWHADRRDAIARHKIELYLNREYVRRKRLPDVTLGALALALANFPESRDAGQTLWEALADPKEAPAVRAACLKALQSFHPRDLEERVVRLAAAPEDAWLRDLQAKLR